MTFVGWLQIALVFGLVLAAAAPLGAFMAKVYAGERTFLSPVLAPFERLLYAAAGVNPAREQGWLGYALGMLAFNAAGFLLLYAILRFQGLLPVNPQGFGGLTPDLAFNTAVSFVTNTNWQSYGGESTMSNFSQMAGLTVQNFLSAATGMALAVALVRAFARSGANTVGNVFVDITRSALYVLLPLAFITAIVQIALGTPQTLDGSVVASTLEGGQQTLAIGPVASQIAIKQIGTNGGGFFNANAAHPFENPNALTDMLTIWQMLLVSTALVFAFGRLVGDRRQGTAILSAMGILLVVGVGLCYLAESAGTPMLPAHPGSRPPTG
jgi:K+-transporting ATPase ATPase A chain